MSSEMSFICCLLDFMHTKNRKRDLKQYVNKILQFPEKIQLDNPVYSVDMVDVTQVME